VQSVVEPQTTYAAFLGEKAAKEQDYLSLGDLAQRASAAGVSETTYSEVSWAAIQAQWAHINQLVDSRRNDLAEAHRLQEHNESLRVDFANKAKDINEFSHQKSTAIDSLSGDIQAQLDQLEAINAEISANQHKFNGVVAANQALEDAQVGDNPHTELSIEGIKSQWDSLNVLSKKKQQVLEKELLAKSGSGLTAEQLQEFRECFKHFDKDADSLLDRLELGACLKALGEDVNFDQGGKLDQILIAIDGDSDGKVTFDEFCAFMEKNSAGTDTPDSIKHAFKTLAGDKDYVTESDLRSVLPADKVDYCLAHMKPYPGVQGGFDYNTFTDTLYGK